MIVQKCTVPNLDIGRSGPFHRDHSHRLVDIQIQQQDFPRVEQNQVMAARLVVRQLHTLIQGGLVFAWGPGTTIEFKQRS